MTSPLDDVAAALVAAEEHVASITAERDALLARVNELDDEVARLVGELEKADDTARYYMHQRDIARAEVERVREVVEAAREYRRRFAANEMNIAAQFVELSKALDRHNTASKQQTKGGDAHEPGPRTSEAGPRQVTPPAPDSTSAACVGGAPLAATAMALELVAECWEQNPFDTVGYTRALRSFGGVLRDKARELREGK